MASKRRKCKEDTPVFRFTLDVRFPNEEEKQAFVARLSAVRDLYSPGGGEKIRNYELLSQLFSLAESTPRPHSAACPQPSNMISVLSSSGKSLRLLVLITTAGKAMKCTYVYTSRYTWIRYIHLFTFVGVYVGDTSPGDQDLLL